ncbi:Glycosyltransferase involved in cell wall bisynthesis [Lentibacillus persicus]|uniref:Glycosyltransferase involved in cell wall bisynthesis n=1 Tax=Lentibacillus persicus TaxID=640948 RepID=A0A1I1UGF4_9BACI|nr:glycosyltransferase [Lentibacillus persicus]SFD67020.1 Glycosyltransferase involved in cell wall bisynthesis [Lentibacillus persicus]
MEPAISIIVPVYNLERYIEKCLDSILAQTFADFEVIIVDDGSTDGSGAICEAYAKKDDRVIVLHNEYGGVSAARNAGIAAAAGKYIGFVDGDDYIDENMYDVLFQQCQQTRSDIAVCRLGREVDGQLLHHRAGTCRIIHLEHFEALRELFRGVLYRFSLCNKLFKQTCFKNVSFPEGRIHEDLSTVYKLFANANKAVYINYIGYIYVRQENSILTSQYNKNRLDAFKAWNEILPYMNKYYSELMADVYACYGFWCVDNAYYVLNQVSNKLERKEHLTTIQENMNGNYKELIRSQGLSFKYKSIVSLINYNLGLLIFSHRFKKALTGGNSH